MVLTAVQLPRSCSEVKDWKRKRIAEGEVYVCVGGGGGGCCSVVKTSHRGTVIVLNIHIVDQIYALKAIGSHCEAL